jgi:hypothetical protein
MSDGEETAGHDERTAARARQSADFMEWSFKLKADSSAWSVEQGMTQVLAYENAEGFALSLGVAVQETARTIHELGLRSTPTALAALRGYQAMATVDTQRELARTHADRLAAHGLPEPPWAPTIGRVRVDGCWWSHDPFDELAFLLCAFSYDGADQHGILAMIDLAVGAGLFRELTLSEDVDSLHDVLRRAHGVDGLVTEPLEPAHARRLVEDTVATTDAVIEDDGGESTYVPAAYRKMRALTLSRARALSDVAAPAQPMPDDMEIELLKQAFLGSDSASGLPAGKPTRQAVDLLVATITEQAAAHPMRLGPRGVLATLGLPELACHTVGDPAVAAILPDLARAWVGWTAAERRLPHDATERLVRAAEQGAAQMRSAGTEGRAD